MARLLPSFAVEPPSPFVGSVHCLDSRNGVWVVTGPGGERARFPTLVDAYDALEYLVSCDLLCALPDFVHLHASGVETAKGAVLALGESGAGKSTLALRWSLSGCPVFGDDVVLVDEAARAHPFQRLFGVHRDRLAEYDEAVAPALETFADAEEAWFDPAVSAGWARPTSIARIALVRYQPGVPLSMTPIGKPDMLAVLSASTMPAGLGAAAAFDRLVQICSFAEAIEVSFGDSREAAEALASLA